MLKIALAKGRLQEDFLDLIYQRNNIMRQNKRSLMFKDRIRNWEILLPKSPDVPQYLEMGMADIGIVGNDVLLECKSDLKELMDLDLGICKMAIAGPTENKGKIEYKTVATKYPNITKDIFRKKGIDANIIYLQGSVELAVATGIADVIVDIVQTGRTLKENGLVVYEELFDINAKLIVSDKIDKRKYAMIDSLINEIERGGELCEYI